MKYDINGKKNYNYDRWWSSITKIEPIGHKKTDEEILDLIDIDVIEKYLRKKKLQKLKKNL
jgi:hypothetical protein